jgi:two-component system, cell cycle sensor histidine kinase and response regulator CckA
MTGKPADGARGLTEGMGFETESRLAEQAALIDAARDAIIVRDLDGTVRLWNRAASELFGVAAEDAIGRRLTDVVHVDRAELDDAVRLTIRDGYWAEELPYTTLDGRDLIVDSRWQTLHDSSGNPDRILSVDTDVTEWRHEEDQRTRAKRMESLGAFAGGIAHDLNNVLTPILMSTQLLKSTETDERALELLSTMEAAARRGADMIRQVLSFVRGVEGRRERVSVPALLEETRRYGLSVLSDSITFGVDVDATAPDVIGDDTQLIQVLTNLIANARDAMPSGGQLRMTASALDVSDDLAAYAFGVAPGRYAVIEVLDSGHGMAPLILESIFEPFFTTKEAGKGTGLGLASSLTIVRSHGGTIRVYSEPDQGTRFSVLLPAAPAADVAAPRGDQIAAPEPRGSGERVLVVDDDAAIRLITTRTLESFGYVVVTAESGDTALPIAESADNRIDLVITDMMMPGGSGAELTQRLRQINPGIPVIVTSGLASVTDAARGGADGMTGFLSKPFTTSLLLTTVHTALHEGRMRR